MKNDKITSERFRKILVDISWDGNAILGENYIDWHTDIGDCGVTLMSTLGDYDIVITKRA